MLREPRKRVLKDAPSSKQGRSIPEEDGMKIQGRVEAEGINFQEQYVARPNFWIPLLVDAQIN